MTVKYQIIVHEIGYRTHKIGSRTHTGLFSSFARNLRAFRGRGGCIVRARFPPKEGAEVFACPLSLQQLPPAHACAFGRGIPQAVGPGREEERRPGVRAAILRGAAQGARIVLPVVGNGAEIGNRHRRFRGPGLRLRPWGCRRRNSIGCRCREQNTFRRKHLFHHYWQKSE